MHCSKLLLLCTTQFQNILYVLKNGRVEFAALFGSYLLKSKAIPIKIMLTAPIELVSFWLNFFAGCQDNLPELLFGCELPPNLIEIFLQDAPQVLSRIVVRGEWGPHHEFPFFYAHSSQRCRGIRYSIVIHIHDIVIQSFIFIPSANLKGPTSSLFMVPG